MARAPMNPLAGPSGPGKYSTRPDQLRMGSTAYGEGGETDAIMRGASMAKTASVRGMPASDVREAAMQQPVTRLFDESQNPAQDIMAGAPIGPEGGPEILGMNAVRQKDNDIISKYIPALDAMASNPDAPESFRIFVRSIQGNL